MNRTRTALVAAAALITTATLTGCQSADDTLPPATSTATTTSTTAPNDIKIIDLTGKKNARGMDVAFVSPTGNLLCAMSDQPAEQGAEPYAACEGGKMPNWDFSQKFCGVDTGAAVTTVQVDHIARWVCRGDVVGVAQIEEQDWWRGRGFPMKDNMAVLPYGYAIQTGTLTCTSQIEGVTCTNHQSGATFFTNKSVTRFDGQHDSGRG